MVQSYEKFSIIVPFRIIFLNYLCKKQQKSGAKGKSLKLLKESGTMFCFLHIEAPSMYAAEHRRKRRQGGSAAAKPVTGSALSSIAISTLGLQRYK